MYQCVKACNVTHNIPQFDNPKDEVKWIWQTSFEHAFPDNGNPYMDEYLKDISRASR